MAVQFLEPTLNPYTPQILCSSVVVDASLTTVQNVTNLVPGSLTGTTAAPLQTPNNFVVTGVFARPIANALNAATTVSLGWGATASTSGTSILSAAAQAGATAGQSIQLLAANAVQTAGTPGQFLNVTFGGTLTGNAKVQVDVIGYFTAA